ncbi:pilus assembly protein CpaE [Novosphingobium sp. KCTC 2891]|uniref:AAA family ATPase n=1 Tax=Novosphingobium sp. KCTC 2891 TaxID=2989730 RepID=UPI00222304EE|nr:pilus assembly protein CpaE [Novosphingobium sp. KCTC 2891]MCW1381601.1 pilus assembly protein CpaE [Novosphingobium sp. KCTC 2891]
MEYSEPPHSQDDFFPSTSPPVGVFISPRQAGDLQEQIDAATRVLLLVRAVEPAEAIPFDKLGGLSVAVLEVDPGSRRSVDRLVQLVRSKPAFPVIAAIATPEMSLVRTLVREGVADVIELPLAVPELTQACLDAIARRAQPATRAKLAPMVAVVRSSGGSGATTIATHLSAELARIVPSGRKVILGDLDLQFGSVGAYLGAGNSGSLPDLIAAEDRIDEELLRALAIETAGGLAVLSIPDAVPSSDSIPMDGLLRVVERLRSIYGLVVLDFPANWSNWSASVAFSADLVLLVTELTLPSIRQARRCVDLFDVIGIDRAKVEIIVNKAEKKLFKPIEVGDVARTLGRSVIAAVPRDTQDLARAQDQGLLIGDIVKRSAFASAIAALAQATARRLNIEVTA